ncbi:MAG: MEDS domain-containing protein [Deltaproteobacteria bacterium]|nr:MEDS domain-containing protein [Deltaproteobacteria bacterium]
MGTRLRRTGIDLIGDVPWGTHFCHFYRTREDLTDILIPFFKAGLEGNEFCVWVTSDPLGVEEAKSAFRAAYPEFDKYLARGQIEVFSYSDWYTKGGSFDPKAVLEGWASKLDGALKKGYEGMRATGNTFWLERKDWGAFENYEKDVESLILKMRMIVLCSYSLEKCTPNEMIDVISNHQFSIARKEGRWAIIESSERKRLLQALHRSASTIEALMEHIPIGITIAEAPDINIRMVSRFGRELAGRPGESLENITFEEHAERWAISLPDGTQPRNEDFPLSRAILKGVTVNDEEWVLQRPDGTRLTVLCNAGPIRDRNGEITAGVAVWRDITKRKEAEEELKKLNMELQEALRKVRILSGILPICASCKRIRDKEGAWKQMEKYIEQHSEAGFSHSLCDECAKKLYPDFA